MGRADFKEIVLINRLDEAGWMRVPLPGASALSHHGTSSSALMMNGITTLAWLTSLILRAVWCSNVKLKHGCSSDSQPG